MQVPSSTGFGEWEGDRQVRRGDALDEAAVTVARPLVAVPFTLIADPPMVTVSPRSVRVELVEGRCRARRVLRVHREVKIFELNGFVSGSATGRSAGADLQGADGGIQIAADRSSLESDGDLAKPKVEGERFHVQGFNERPERSVESHRQVVG